MKRWFRRGKLVAAGDYVVEHDRRRNRPRRGARPSGRQGSPSRRSKLSHVKVVLPDAPSSSFPTARPASTPRPRSGRSWPSRRCSCGSNGEPRDLRAPLADGEQIQILTTRDKDDPDALYVLRHSTAHLLAEAVRRLYPGVKIAIGPPIENGFYYDFEFPEPIHEADLEKIEDEIGKELKDGRSWTREEISREDARSGSRRRASRTRSSSSTPPRATSRSTRRATSPTSAAARTSRTRRRSRRSSSPGSRARTGAATRRTRS